MAEETNGDTPQTDMDEGGLTALQERLDQEDAERANTNVLEGIRCPKCGSYEPFYIGPVDVTLRVWDDGTEHTGDVEWDDETDITCIECDHLGTVGEFKHGIIEGVPISAEVTRDDGEVRVDFDAAPYFAAAGAEQILALSRCGWGGDYPADYVAQYFADQHDGIKRATQTQGMGFECHVDATEAMTWLAANRPEVHEVIEREASRGE